MGAKAQARGVFLGEGTGAGMLARGGDRPRVYTQAKWSTESNVVKLVVPNSKVPVLFYAYPSNPPDVGETIETVSKLLNAGKTVISNTWHDADIVGLRVIKQVTKKIDDCNIFCCDLTYLNMNVLFELGYAIAKNKKIFISMNTDIRGHHERFSSITPLISIGYQGYRNSGELQHLFYDSNLIDKSKPSLADSLRLFDNKEENSIFYIKSSANSDAVTNTSDLILSYPGQNIVDDPKEMPADTLTWYCNKIEGSEAVISHFMSDKQLGSDLRNFKIALISGIAYGRNKPIYMLAPEPFAVPSDMPDMVKTYETARSALDITRLFLDTINKNKDTVVKERDEYKANKERNKNLGRLNLGEPLAENESEHLSDYFVETGSFNEIISGTQSLFLGRKGTGKTASLYAAKSHFSRDTRNLVVTIKPSGYEVDGLVEILSQANTKEAQGFFLESLWKYLIYTEICKTIVDNFLSNPNLYQDLPIEDLIRFSESYESVIMQPFSERLRNTIESVDINSIPSGESVREYISRKLHSGILKILSKKLLPVINRYKILAVLIDNLDKGWHSNIKVREVAEVIFGLLSMSRKISEEIRNDARGQLNVNIKMTIFLRSDIYTHILDAARERDKLDIQTIEWNDKEILGRVLDERIIINDPEKTPNEMWREMFSSFEGSTAKEFILDWIRPRPRDAIFLMKSSISEAISLGHSKVEYEDLTSAREIYSDWAFNSLIDEDDPEKLKLRDIIYEFLGEEKVLDESEVLSLITKATDEEDKWKYLDLLCDSHFLEIENNAGEFVMMDNRDRRDRHLIAARKRAIKEDTLIRYQISKPYWALFEFRS